MKILAAVPLAYDATSYYRAYGIFPDLKEKLGELEISTYQGRGWTWAELSQFDVLFLQRASHPDWLKLAKYCKSLGIKIWVDHDDNLFQLPPYNRVYDTYTPEVKNCMLEIIKTADLVTVSTPALQKLFKSFGVESHVVPNALNDKLTQPVKEYNKLKDVPPPQKKVEQIVWRGSETHMADFYFLGDELVRAISQRPNTYWSFIGYNPWFVTINFAENWKYHKPDDFFVYWENLKRIKPQIMHVPLFEDNLNECKSNIAWIEGTAAGAVVIAPDWPEWQKPGVVNYKDQEDYHLKLITPIENAEQLWRQSMDYINENLLLSKVNKKRAELLMDLMKEDKTIYQVPEPTWVKTYGNNLPPTMIE